MRDDHERLLDIMEAITRIEKYAARGREAFDADELIQVYIIHHLQILGEAAYKLSAQSRSSNAQVPWPKILGMRHILVHDYFRIDHDIVWGVVETDLPVLRPQIEAILKGLA